MKLTEALKSIALQSGVSETELKSILENPALASIEVDEAVSTKLTASRLSMEAAKNNPDLKKHFTALALNGVDAELERTATELGVNVEDLKGLDSTSKRVSALAKMVKDAEAAKAGKGTADTEKLNKTIEDLNGQIAKVREETLAQLKAKDDGLETERIDWTMNSILSNYEYATGVDKDINITVAKTLINKELSNKGLNIVRKEGNLTLQTKDGMEYFDNNVKVNVSDFTTKTLANAKVLKTSNSTQTKTATTQVQRSNDANAFKNVDSVLAALEK